jgi:hypothetical protein
MILSYNIRVIIQPAVQRPPLSTKITVNIQPAITPEQTFTEKYEYQLNVIPFEVDITNRILQSADVFLTDIYNTYIDENRTLKTLLNLGEDRQIVALNWRSTPPDSFGTEGLQIKLLNPIPDDIALGTRAFISRELANTTIDTFRVRFAPAIDATPYLRPKNTSVKVGADLGKSLNQVTYKILQLQTGSLGSPDATNNTTFEDQIYRQWYSYDFNSSELNLNFSDYAKFVFYGSAAMRLAAFREKLLQLEKLEESRKQFDGNVFTGELASAGANYILEQSSKLAVQKETLIRTFDRYEQYLYFTPSTISSPYSASFDYVDGGTEYNPTGYWPKSGSIVWPATSNVATEWYATQSAIAQRFDEFNENNLVNTIPTHIREYADDNGSYITFVSMIGHFFDNIKPYVDQFPNIYSRYINPNEELSKDLVTDVAAAVGFPLPTLNSIYDLSDNILGTTQETPRRDYTVETHKRLLHNLPFFAKAKGTKTALNMLLKTFGLSEQLLRVYEVGSANESSTNEASVNTFTEYSTGFRLTQNDNLSIRLPISASARTPYPSQLQFSFDTQRISPMTVLTGDNLWALHLRQHPDNQQLARLELTSGSTHTPILTSSYYEMFGDTILNVTLRNYEDTLQSSLAVYHTVDGDILYESFMIEPTMANTFIPLWNNTNVVHLGGSGSLVQNRIDAIVDEVRLWGKNLSNEMVLVNAFDPGSIAGDVYTDPTNFLYVQLSFAAATTGSLINSIQNESPFIGIGSFPSLTNIQTVGGLVTTNNFVRYSRSIRQAIPLGTFNTPITNKIQIAAPPVFTPANVTGNGVKQLSRTSSIVSRKDKRIQRGRNKVSIVISPTEIINQNIIRTIGLENINGLLASPSALYTELSKELDTIKKYYAQYYYANVNINNFIRILSNINSVLNEVVEYFIPSKATLLSGIVIQQNIFEQIKIAPIRKLRVYGKNTRKTLGAASSLTGSAPEYDATFNVDKTIRVVPEIPTGTVPYYTGNFADNEVTAAGTVDTTSTTVSIAPTTEVLAKVPTIMTAIDKEPVMDILSNVATETTNIAAPKIIESITVTPLMYTSSVVYPIQSVSTQPCIYELQHISSWNEYRIISKSNNESAKNEKVSIPMGLDMMNKIPYNDVNGGSDGAEPYNRVYPRKLFTYEIESRRIGGNTSLVNAGINIIPPSADFNDFGVRTYFNRRTGIYYVPQTFLTPRTTRVLNQTWNFENQEFDSVNTWQYGQRYTFNDVVYQNVQDFDENLPSSIIKAAKAGNKRYYVLKTRPSYVPPNDGTSFYLDTVPTYSPPSLDRENWQILWFKPIERRVPKRAVFDVFTVADPIENNYAITTLDIDTVIDIPDRYIDSFSIGLIPANGQITGELAVQNMAVLFALQASQSGIRVRLYRTAQARNLDSNRLLLDLNYQNTGVLLDTVISTQNIVTQVNTIATLVADSVPPAGKIFYTIDNLTSTTKIGTNLLLYYFATQIEPRIPFGYLPKHYRFFRENTTATKRRNWLGCKNTVDTTIDGLPPVQVFIGEGTALSISSTNQNDEIVTGGGGTLNIV